MRQQDVRLLKAAERKPCANNGEVKVFSRKCSRGNTLRCFASGAGLGEYSGSFNDALGTPGSTESNPWYDR